MIFICFFAMVPAALLLTACGSTNASTPDPEPTPVVEHQHTATEWTTDAAGHWHVCTTDNEKFDYAEHTFATKHDQENYWNVCTVCGYATEKTTLAPINTTNVALATSTLTYNGAPQTVTVKGLPADVVVERLINNRQIDAGEYVATAVLKYIGREPEKHVTTATVTLPWKINQAALAVKAADVAVHVGCEPHGATYTVTGFVPEEDARVLRGTAQYQFGGYDSATATDGATFDITVTGLSARNYTIAYEKGTLTATNAIVERITNGNKTYLNTLGDATSGNNMLMINSGTYKLLGDVAVEGMCYFYGYYSQYLNVTLDLNGYTLTSNETTYPALRNSNLKDSTITIKNGIIKVDKTCKAALWIDKGNTLKLENDLTIISNATEGAVHVYGEGTTLETSAKIISAHNAAIIGNGDEANWGTTINITGGVIEVADEDGDTLDVAIYHPQNGTINISGDVKIKGKTALELRAGTATISGGTFTATKTTMTAKANSNGATTQGAALAISQHSTNLPMNVTIRGGKFEGAASLYFGDLQNHDSQNAKFHNVTVEITGGEFNGQIAREADNDGNPYYTQKCIMATAVISATDSATAQALAAVNATINGVKVA